MYIECIVIDIVVDDTSAKIAIIDVKGMYNTPGNPDAHLPGVL